MIFPAIHLPITEAKCIGSACTHPGVCARYSITYTAGRPLADFSTATSYGGPECNAARKWPKFVSLSDAVAPPKAQPAPRDWIGQ